MAVIIGSDGTPSGFTPDPAHPFGVWGDSGSPGAFGGGGNGVLASSKFSSGVAGFTLSTGFRAAGVFGSGLVGVAGTVTGATTAPFGRVGVYGTGSNAGSLGAIGVFGESDVNSGVFGQSQAAEGVAGISSTDAGVRGVASQGFGVVGISNGTGVVGLGGAAAGEFFGDVDVTGTLSKGGGGFLIDHPLDPANKQLRHSFVESPDMKNVYDGIVICDQRGEAAVDLPAWFDALNADFRYQLTAIGAAAPGLFIAEEIAHQRFKIAGGSDGLKVSWQVTATRQDAWAQAHRLVVEEDKPMNRRGRYLHPVEHGVGEDQGVASALYADARRRLGLIKP
jgi:hypothetical protein